MATNATRLLPFSASVQGQGVKIVQTSTPGTLVHTTGTSATDVDEVWLYLYNSHTADVLVTIEFGGATAPDDNLVQTVPFKQGATLAIPGWPLLGNGTVALTVKVFAAVANVIIVNGKIFRITP